MTARKYLKRLGGFTLVELLIVIALLGIIALIVIAAINPIEQANRARDTGMKSDGSQLVSAIDRYFTARFEFPWVSQNGAAYPNGNDDSFGFVSAGSYEIGICANGGGTDDCDNDGVLITTDELKPEFRNRNFIQAHVASNVTDELMMGKVTGSSSSVYACYIPRAKSNRERACADGYVYTLNASDGSRTQITAGDASCAAESTDWVQAPGPYYVCVPQ